MSNIKKTLTISDKIRRARQEARLSQRQLGEALKLSDKAISAYEVGRAVPTIETLREISRVTYKPFVYFVNEQAEDQVDLEERIVRIEKDLAEIKLLLQNQHKQG